MITVSLILQLAALFSIPYSSSAFVAPSSNRNKRSHEKIKRYVTSPRPPFGIEDKLDDRYVDIRTALDRVNILQQDGLGSSSVMLDFQRRIQKNVSFRKSSIAGAGQGLYAKRNIKAGTVIGFYPVHGIGASFDDESSICCGITTEDQEYFDDVKEVTSDYIQLLIGSRRLGVADFGDDTTLFINVNPGRVDSTGVWISHYINDGATVSTNSEGGMLDYYSASQQHKNCVHVPFGPAPLMATVTTRKVKKGEELFTSYGCLYWIDNVLKEGEECVDVTDAVQMEAKQTALDLFTAMNNAQIMYFNQQDELQEDFDKM